MESDGSKYGIDFFDITEPDKKYFCVNSFQSADDMKGLSPDQQILARLTARGLQNFILEIVSDTFPQAPVVYEFDDVMDEESGFFIDLLFNVKRIELEEDLLKNPTHSLQ